VLVLARSEFLTLIDEFADIRTAVLEALAQRVRRLEPDAG
jgi:CRP-like cAMP-binding protein